MTSQSQNVHADTDSGTSLGTGPGTHIDLSDVSRSFLGTGSVVEPLNLHINAGEFVSFLGPSGCGKSTLLRMIAGLDRPDGGNVELNESRHFFRGFVFQEAQLLPWRTVLGNVMLPLELMKRSRAEAESAARTVLHQVGLGDAFEKFPSQLSGGMKMRVSLARALVGKPSLLLLDEPFAALDEITRQKLQEDLRSLFEKSRMTIIFVTHSVSEAVFLSDRAVVFSKRPARVLLDRAIALSPVRRNSTRFDTAYASEVEAISRALRAEVEA